MSAAEYSVRVEAKGRVVDEWKLPPEQPDNHWFDCLVGSAVAASMQGAILFGIDSTREIAPKRLIFKDIQQNRRK